MPITTASTGTTVACVAMLDSRSVKISMPPVVWSKPMSTVTPQTIRIVPHGMRLDRLAVVRRAQQRQQHGSR